MPSPLLDVQDLTLSSANGPIIEHLSFQLFPGEIVALTGSSGSGKTSIGLAILNLLPEGIRLTSGRIGWQGNNQTPITLPADSSHWSSLRGSHIGYTQQDVFGAYDPVMEIGRQMVLIIHERIGKNFSDIGETLKLKMAEVGLQDIDRLWHSFPFQLSGGQLQRCLIAMSITMQPELLIADEPTSAIDKINQYELLEVYSMLRKKYNTAILCITHEEAVVRHLADREIRLGDLTSDFSKTNQTEPQSVNAGIVLEVKDLQYDHQYGGLFTKSGATVGPLNFAIHKGRCLGIVGESGSGKSTLAQMLVGLLIPIEGDITLEQRIIDFQKPGDVRFLRSKVQLVLQDGRGALHPHMTVQRLLQQVVEIEQDFTSLLAKVGLPASVLGRRASQLSGGECLRVNIARALLLEPKILICDESTSALDGRTRDSVIDLLLSLKIQQGLSLVFISHDDQLIKGVAEEIIVMHEGEIVQKALAGAVVDSPGHPVTRKIFGGHATPGSKGGSLKM